MLFFSKQIPSLPFRQSAPHARVLDMDVAKVSFINVNLNDSTTPQIMWVSRAEKLSITHKLSSYGARVAVMMLCVLMVQGSIEVRVCMYAMLPPWRR